MYHHVSGGSLTEALSKANGGFRPPAPLRERLSNAVAERSVDGEPPAAQPRKR